MPYSGKFSGVLIFLTSRVRPPELNFVTTRPEVWRAVRVADYM